MFALGEEASFEEGEAQNLEALRWMESNAGMQVVWKPNREAFFARVVEDVYPVIEKEPWFDADLVARIRALGQ